MFVLHWTWATDEAFGAYRRDAVTEEQAFHAEAGDILTEPIQLQFLHRFAEEWSGDCR